MHSDAVKPNWEYKKDECFWLEQYEVSKEHCQIYPEDSYKQETIIQKRWTFESHRSLCVGLIKEDRWVSRGKGKKVRKRNYWKHTPSDYHLKNRKKNKPVFCPVLRLFIDLKGRNHIFF
jgi:hypothetical protein